MPGALLLPVRTAWASLDATRTVRSTYVTFRSHRNGPNRPLLSKPFWEPGAAWRSSHTSKFNERALT